MKVNFNAIVLKDIEGNEQKISVSADLGNAMYMRGENIEECELGRRIYSAGKNDEEIELSESDVKCVGKYIKGYSYIVRDAINRVMTLKA